MSGALVDVDFGSSSITHALNYILSNTKQIGGVLKGANFNVTTDQAIAISSPASVRYMIDSICVVNASYTLATAVGGVYGAASKGNPVIVPASQAYSGLTATTADTADNAMEMANTDFATMYLDLATLYFSLTTPEGATATADIYVWIKPLP